MADKSAIEWTDATWNPVTGCTKISPGCKNCYAERLAERLQAMGNPRYRNGFTLTLHPDQVDLPLRWRSPKRIFVNSMSDLFHEDIPDEFIQTVFQVMNDAHWHNFQVLTKRAERLARLAPALHWTTNIWQGVSVESAAYVTRMDYLRQVPAAIRFVSIEPLLSAIPNLSLNGIDWVIVGGESGPYRRPPTPNWVQEIRDLCTKANVAFFFKQWGGRTSKSGGNVLDGKTWLQYPKVPSLLPEKRYQLVGKETSEMETDGPNSTVGPWAKEKLGCLRKYLDAYTTIMQKQAWLKGFVYVDAFSGSGHARIRGEEERPDQINLWDVAQYYRHDPEHEEYLTGSPRVALQTSQRFTQYVFVETDVSNVSELNRLQSEFPNVNIAIRQQDCNKYLRETFLRRKWDKLRAIVFLDPFGMQVPWNTIELLAETKAIEVFLNFPVGMAIQRLLRRDGQFTPRQRGKLDQYFGSPEWFQVIYQEDYGLFGKQLTKAPDSNIALTKWYRSRLEKSFGYSSSARLIRTSTNRPLYYLLHAGPNKTGAKIAEHILKQGEVIK